MADDQSWDAKRDEIWRRIVGVENALKELTKGLSSVKALAESRVSVDEKLANDAAKKAVEGAKQVEGAVELVRSWSNDIEKLRMTLPNVSAKANQLDEFYKSGEKNKELCAAIVKELNGLQTDLSGILDAVTKKANEVGAKVTIVEQQAQAAQDLKDRISSDAGVVRTCRDEVNELKAEFKGTKESLDTTLLDAQSKLTELHDTKLRGLDSLIKGKTEELDVLCKEKGDELTSLIEKCAKNNERFSMERKEQFDRITSKAQKNFEDLRKKIEMLLPGATSAGLASAFRERKITLGMTKGLWVSGLMLSVGLLLVFGYISSQGFMVGVNWIAAFTGRSMIVVGLIFVEEFCRRNYNVAARLTEAYAYKEVLSKSYFGYKKEMASMPMPKDSVSDPDNKGDSVLMSTLLDKLGEDPGDDVFDKERQVVGIGSIIDALQCNKRKNTDMSSGGQDGNGSIDAQLPAGRFAAKVTWPVVVFAGVVVVAICVLLCFFITYGVIGGNECLDVNRSSKNRPLVHAQIGDGVAIGSGIGNKAMIVTKH